MAGILTGNIDRFQTPVLPLVESPKMAISAEKLEAALSGLSRKVRLIARDECPSTNQLVKQAMDAENEQEAVLAVTGYQSEGEGRRGRLWHSPRGTDVLATLGVRLADFNYELDPRFPLLASVLVARGVNKASDVHLHTKWPNDLVSDERRKIGGILVRNTRSHLAIGIGVNVNGKRADYPEEIQWRVGTLSELAGRKLDLTRLTGAIIAELLLHFAGEHPLNADGLIDEWLDRSLTIGEPLLLHRDGELAEVTPLRLIRETCELIVRESDGSETLLSSADAIEY